MKQAGKRPGKRPGRRPQAVQGLMRCDVRSDVHIPGLSVSRYGQDESGTVTYAFNSAGYRGDDYDPNAKLRICVIGESHAVGTGVEYAQTFGHRFKQHVATALDADEDKINLINLAVGGCSTDYCTRTLYRQLASVTFDLVICHLPPQDRVEYLGSEGINNFNVSGTDPGMLEGAPDSLMGYLDFYTPQNGAVNQVKNALLLQSLLKREKVDYILTTQDLARKTSNDDLTRPFTKQLDYRHILRHKFFHNRADYAADGRHAGVQSHGAIAVALMSHYARLLGKQGPSRRAKRIASYAETLLANDPDWAFCNDFIANKRASDA